MTTEGDVRLTDLIRVYDDALDAQHCERVIELFEADTEGQFQRKKQNTWIENIMTRNPLGEWRELERMFIENMVRYLREYSAMPEARVLARKGPRARGIALGRFERSALRTDLQRLRQHSA